MANVEIISNKDAVMRKVMENMKKAAKAIGGIAESHAKEYCPVDTGLLRNSITYALGGETPSRTLYYDNAMENMGQYDGQAPDDTDNQVTVYTGTNVKYGIFQELGAPSINLPAQPFIRPAMENHMSEYQQAIRMYAGSI